MGSFDEAWQVICDYFQNEKKITEVAYKTWISRIVPKNIDFEKGEVGNKIYPADYLPSVAVPGLQLDHRPLQQGFRCPALLSDRFSD